MTNDSAASAATARPPLTRPAEGRVLVGVCAGFGRYTDVDPVIYRVILIVLTIFGGLGAVLYGVGWLLIPSERTGDSVADRLIRRFRGRRLPRMWVGIALAVIAVIALANMGSPRNVTVTLLLLALIGYLLISRHGAPVIPPPPAPPTPPPADVPLPVVTETAPVDFAPPPPPPTPSPPPAPRPPRSRLGLITVSAALVVTGLLIAARQAGAEGVTVTRILATALAVIGAGLVVGAWMGRARWLVIPGALLAVATVTVASIDVPITGGTGNRNWTPTTVADLQPTYHLGIGDAVLDLRELPLRALRQPLDATVAMSVGIGHAKVILPPYLGADVHAHTDIGAVDVLTRSEGGLDTDVTTTIRPLVASEGTVHLDIDAGVGRVEVVRG